MALNMFAASYGVVEVRGVWWLCVGLVDVVADEEEGKEEGKKRAEGWWVWVWAVAWFPVTRGVRALRHFCPAAAGRHHVLRLAVPFCISAINTL